MLVTNGGYGSVDQAMSFGIPLVTAGLTEDKADVNARVAWSGVGINLATNEPSRDALRSAVKTVLDQPGYRLRARQMAAQFAAIDTRSEIPGIVSQLVADERELSEADTLAARQPRRAGQRGHPTHYKIGIAAKAKFGCAAPRSIAHFPKSTPHRRNTLAPLQTKPFHVEIDETGDGVIERRDGFRSGRRTRQSLADDA